MIGEGIILKNTDLVKISNIIASEYSDDTGIKAIKCVSDIFSYFGKPLLPDEENNNKFVDKLTEDPPGYDVTSGGWLRALNEIRESHHDLKQDTVDITFTDGKNKISIHVKFVDIEAFANLYKSNKNLSYFGMTEADWNGVHLMKTTEEQLPQFTCIETRCKLWGGVCKNWGKLSHSNCMKHVRMSDDYFTKIKHSNGLCSNCYRSRRNS